MKKIESVEDEPEEEAKADTEVTEAVEAASEVDTAALPVVDLTEEAIQRHLRSHSSFFSRNPAKYSEPVCR